jgi:hypothetical protein
MSQKTNSFLPVLKQKPSFVSESNPYENRPFTGNTNIERLKTEKYENSELKITESLKSTT